ncbi:MAG: septum site-determining protein MinC [Cyanobacteriota bacterium]|nr:septum site-determining protein MinC [Cyanobacteriota bacterium]
MTSDSGESPSVPTPLNTVALTETDSQVLLKREGDRVCLSLPRSDRAAASDWSEIWEQLKHRLNSGERFWQTDTPLHLLAQERLLDSRQLQQIAEALAEVGLKIERVYASRRQTAVAAAMAGYCVEQQSGGTSLIEPEETPVEAAESPEPPLYLRATLRSGVEIRHPGTVAIFGDINPGCTVIASGDILVWGRLRGIAHAGARGDRARIVAALQMEATQLRIADVLARVPQGPPGDFYPEIACVSDSGIHLTKASNFAKTYTFNPEAKGWIELKNDSISQ